MIGRLDVFVGVASIPSREASLQHVVERLLPQARRIGVYLNGYDRVPRFLRRRRIVVARSQDQGDLRDNGKFFFLSRSDSRYYATVDDDLIYPHDYLQRLVACLNEAEQRAAVGVHGAIYPSPIGELFDPRYLFHFADPTPHVMPVHLLGTGTALFDQSDWKLDSSEFGRPGMADVWFAAAAAKRNAGLFVTRRIRNWVSEFDEDKGAAGALFFEGLLDNSEQVKVLREVVPPTRAFHELVRPFLRSRVYSDEFSLLQALELDRIRSQLGYPPLSAAEAAEVEELLTRHRRAWVDNRQLSDTATDSIARLAAEIMSDRLSAEALIPVLDLLERLHDLALTVPQQWNRLPPAVRYDSSPERVERLEMTLVERAMHGSRGDAPRLWAAIEDRDDIPLDLAMEAERASIPSGFASMPALAELAMEDPESAAARLYDYFEAVDWQHEPDVAALRKVFGSSFESLEVQMLVCQAAARSGNRDSALRAVRRLRQRSPWDGDIRLLEAGLSVRDGGTPGDAIRPLLKVLDDALEPQGVKPFQSLLLDGGEATHWIHHLRSEVGQSRASSRTRPMVSVLMTTYNDGETIGAAAESILASEGVDLELIVVDDASTDDTLDRLRSIDDPRMKLVPNEVNLGPYLSRNRGLEHASGEYIAIADGDDWSHPQRLRYQASILDESAHLIACKVAHIRIRRSGLIDLENHLRFVGDGPVSLMFRRWLVDHIGGFDHVRTRGDIEYLRRIMARFGPSALASFSTPLLLATSSPASNSKRFREESLNLYRAAARKWHERRALSDGLYVPLAGSRAPFMAPYDLLAASSPLDDGEVTDLVQQSAT